MSEHGQFRMTALYALADAVAFELSYDKKANAIMGSTEVKLKLLEGQEFGLNVKVVDWLADWELAYVGVLLHVSGQLYVSVVVDYAKYKVTVLVLNGQVLDLKPNKRNAFFPATWSRKKLYMSVLPGVKAGFERKIQSDEPWVLLGKGNAWMREYLVGRGALAPAAGAPSSANG